MFNWKKALQKKGESPAEGTPEHFERIQVATSAILLETAEYDENFSDVERKTISGILQDRFGVSAGEAAELMAAAARERKETLGIRPFTHFVNENYSDEERKRILEEAWRVIYADGRLNAYEDHFVHRLASLLRLEHEDLIATKLKVKHGRAE